MTMDLREFAKRAWYFGFRYECAVCGARTRVRKTYSFDLPVLREKDVVGGEYLENDDCPICYGNQRSRLIYSYFKQLAPLKRGAAVLHVAPELMLYRYLFKRADIDYHPVDLSPERYIEVPAVEKVDITQIPYPDETFDVVLCNHVLEHVPDDRRAMRELRRVLKRDGIALLQAPLGMKLSETDEDPTVTDEAERERRFGQFDHIRIYAERDYVARLREAGFAMEIASVTEVAGAEGAQKYQLNPRERLFIGRPADVRTAARPHLAAGLQ
jgi:SAM-dependent methyltransferase